MVFLGSRQGLPHLTTYVLRSATPFPGVADSTVSTDCMIAIRPCFIHSILPHTEQISAYTVFVGGVAMIQRQHVLVPRAAVAWQRTRPTQGADAVTRFGAVTRYGAPNDAVPHAQWAKICEKRRKILDGVLRLSNRLMS